MPAGSTMIWVGPILKNPEAAPGYMPGWIEMQKRFGFLQAGDVEISVPVSWDSLESLPAIGWHRTRRAAWESND